jgi:proteasome lid subunit RPN8/RPN11
MGDTVVLPDQVAAAVIAHAAFCSPEEACGLLASDAGGALRMAYATTNADHSPVRFTVAPEEHFAALRHAERQGWIISGSFHSHPASAPYPSRRDIEGGLEPDWLYLIVGLATGRPQVRGYRIRKRVVSTVTLVEG